MAEKNEGKDTRTGLEIAVIGMSGRFPGAANIDEFWENLKNGVESISFFSDQELEESGVEPGSLEDPNFVKARGIIKDVEYFDASFFDYTPQEAEIMDPQMRVFHECSWEALEDAGYAPESYNGRIGVYGGGSSSYYWLALSRFSKATALMGNIASVTLYNKDFLCKRISYNFNLIGPSFSLYTACSTSLVAIDLACKGLLTGQCDIALAGGVSIKDPRKGGYQYGEGMIVSPDGHNRTFDSNAKGTVFGNGAGVVVLKPLGEAEEDGDSIYAIIKSSAVNNDGINKSNFAAPGLEGQARVIRAALHMAEVAPESIGYIEAHGTATEVGDPIEIEGLKRAFNTDKRGFCAIGSVKSNMGHLDCAAGVTGLIKVVLALNHKLIPPSLHFENPNAGIDFANSPFYVNTRLIPWHSNGNPLRAGVSSFGIGGTNAHVILEEAPIEHSAQHPAFSKERTGPGAYSPGVGGIAPPDRSRQHQLILLSAKTPTALDKMTKNIAEYFKNSLLNHGNHENPVNPGLTLADVAYTLQIGRTAFDHRRYIVCSTVDKAIAALTAPGSPRVNVNTVFMKDDEKPVIFMFPGQGAQYVNMGLELYETERVFREEMERCFKILESMGGYDWKRILYPTTSNSHPSPDINRSEIAQPLLFAFEYALAKLLIDWGIEPQTMIGYSLGEYAAACISGVLSLEDALKIIVTRGQLIQKIPAGAMLSVPLSREELIPLLNSNFNSNHELSLAIDNGPSCVVAGPSEAVDAFEKQMKEKKMLCMGVPVSHALHSKMMEPILHKFAAAIEHLACNKHTIPYISDVSGTWITAEQTTEPTYWVTHLRETVQFAAGLQELIKESNCIFVEVGPGRDLTALVSRYIEENPNQHALDVVRVESRKISDTYYLLNRIGLLWLYGVKIDWHTFHAREKRRRVPLPSYPFERQRYMIEGDFFNKGAEMVSVAATQLKKKNIEHWFYIPTWIRRALRPRPSNDIPGSEHVHCLVFLDDDKGIGPLLVKRLKQDGHEVITVKAGSEFTRITPGTYVINPQQTDHYYRLFKEIASPELIPYRIVHIWGVTVTVMGNGHGEPGPGSDADEFDKMQDLGFYSLLNIAKAIGKENLSNRFQITVVTNQMQEVTGEEPLCPGKATVLGPVKVIPQEYPGIRCRSIDIVLPGPGSLNEETLVEQLSEEISTGSGDTVVAYRGNFRWVQTFEPVRLDKTRENAPISKLKEKGVYLITGGLGNIGLILAEHLAKKVKAKLILTGRSTMPPAQEWDRWMARHNKQEQDPVTTKIKQIRKLEEAGAEVLVFTADSANKEQMQAVIARAEQEFGTINGIIHAAGIVKGKSICVIQKMERAHCQEQFRPKIHGLLVLESLLKDKELDFCWLVSSISTVLGGLELAAYAAANGFMDAFVKKHNRLNRSKWISVDWEGKEAEETRIGFERILSLDKVEQVVFARGGNLQERIDRWVKLESPEEDNAFKEDSHLHSQPRRPRPNLLNSYVPPQKELEKMLVGIWQTLFGFERLGIQDDFIELGGDSLKAIQIITRVHKELNVSIPLTDFFKEPTIERLADYITNAERDIYYSITPVEERKYYPLSSAQKRLYILHQMDPGTLGYNFACTNILEGKLDRVRLTNSFLRLIERHESLRTSFHLINSEPVQRVHDNSEVEFEIEYYDLTTEDTGRGELATSVIKNFIRPFDLSLAPLLRVGVIRVEKEEHILVVDMHHIIHDGVSQVIFLKDFSALYAGEELPGLKNQYKEYSQWQNRHLEREAVKKQGKYWIDQFKGEIPLLNLAGDYARPVVQSHVGNVLPFDIEIKETNALRELALKEEATLFIVLLSIYITLLSKLSGQEDIVVGTPVAGRRHSDLQPIIGIFLNTLALRNFPAASKPFGAFLKEVKERTLTAFDNQDHPFEDLVEQLEVNRDLSRNPLFDVMFIWHNQWDIQPGEIPPQTSGALKLKPHPYKKSTSEFDMTLIGNEVGNRIQFKIEYCTKLFKPGTIQRFINYFKEIVSSVLKDPGKKISELDMTPAEDKRRVLYEFNDTAREYPRRETIHELFARQVERIPNHTALVGRAQDTTRSQHLTYKELQEKSHRLAQVLKRKGVRPGTIVAIMVERSIEMVVGLLGILQAGGAYLPLDPLHPAARLSSIIRKSDTRMLLTSARVKEAWPILDFNVEIIDILDEKKEKLSPVVNKRETDRSTRSSPVDMAYVIYTSGSTGNPKGVIIEHRNAVNFFTGMMQKIGFAAAKSIVALTTISFDISVLELLQPLVIGMRVVIACEEEQTDPSLLVHILMKNRVEILQITPSHLKLLLSIPGKEDFLEHIDILLVGGEAFPQHLFEVVTDKFRGSIYNMYGPTETTIWSTVKDLTGAAGINIGSPIANTRVYILNRGNQAQPVGVPGELCIGGDGVSRGYLNNPELTAEKFTRPPTPSIIGGGAPLQVPPEEEPTVSARALLQEAVPGVYRTGDLARWLPDGDIEFIGRIDHQVKIRGFRIELEEIQEELLGCEGVTAALVVPNIDENNDRYLSAYIVSGEEVKIGKLREYLLQKLPVYMIPSYFIQVDRIPLTPNGKVDRKNLPSPGDQRARLGTTYLAPSSEIEKTIAEVWTEILHLEKVGIHDSFFDLGGNSLNIIQLNNRLREKLEIDIPVVSMFRYFTISSFTKYLNDMLERSSPGVRESKPQQLESLKQAAKTYKNSIKHFRKGVKHGTS